MTTERRDLDAILDTLREVEGSLQARTARAEGANLIVWGVVGASIFLFYQLVEWNHHLWHAMLGPFLPWVWTGPILVGYMMSAMIGARIGRITSDAATRRRFRLTLVPAALAALLVTTLVLTQRYDAVYGGVPLVTGLSTIALTLNSPRREMRAVAYASGAGMTLVGVALLVWSVPWASLAAAVAFVVGLVGLGSARYRLAG